MITWKIFLICFLIFVSNDSWKKKLKVVKAADISGEDNYLQVKNGQCSKQKSSRYNCEYKNPCDDKSKSIPIELECEEQLKPEEQCEEPEKKIIEAPTTKISKGRKQGACGDGISVTVDCEECELQIKAGGGGVFLKCKKCNELKPEDNLLPPLKPYRVIRLP